MGRGAKAQGEMVVMVEGGAERSGDDCQGLRGVASSGHGGARSSDGIDLIGVAAWRQHSSWQLEHEGCHL